MPFKDLGHHPEHMGHVVDHEHPDAIETGDARSCWGWPASGAHPLYAPWWRLAETSIDRMRSVHAVPNLAKSLIVVARRAFRPLEQARLCCKDSFHSTDLFP